MHLGSLLQAWLNNTRLGHISRISQQVTFAKVVHVLHDQANLRSLVSIPSKLDLSLSTGNNQLSLDCSDMALNRESALFGSISHRLTRGLLLLRRVGTLDRSHTWKDPIQHRRFFNETNVYEQLFRKAPGIELLRRR